MPPSGAITGCWHPRSCVLGLEGGYALDKETGLPTAVANTLRAYAEPLVDTELAPGVSPRLPCDVVPGAGAAELDAVEAKSSLSASSFDASQSLTRLRAQLLSSWGLRPALGLVWTGAMSKREFLWSRALRMSMSPAAE